MGEIMQLPETVEEFMQQYKITDTQQVYTNGTELVPISRMKICLIAMYLNGCYRLWLIRATIHSPIPGWIKTFLWGWW